MSDESPTLMDIWRLLGSMNERFGAIDQRFDALERQIVANSQELAKLRGDLQAGFGALKGAIEARDFRLDEHGRRLTELETSRT